jgi:EF-hand domain pair
MMFALGAAGSVLDGLQSLISSKSSSSTTSANPGQGATDPFAIGAGTQSSGTATTGFSAGTSAWTQISPQTMSALIDAQSQSATTSTAPTNPQDALKDLFSQIDANGDGSINKSEFESALGAGGTNLAAADDVFSKLDSNGDGSVSLDELKNALQGAGGHHGGHHHVQAGGGDAGGSGDASSADGSTDPNADPLLQALAGASSTSVSNSDGSTTTSITYADGSKVSLTTPAVSTTSTSSSNATSSYNWIEQMIQRQAQSLSASLASSFSVSA